jgi:hypothetical protein
MPDAQIVYTVVQPSRRAPRRCSPLPADAVPSVPVAPRFPRILFGTVAQYDEAEDEVDEGFVPVRVGVVRTRVIAAPLDAIRVVG